MSRQTRLSALCAAMLVACVIMVGCAPKAKPAPAAAAPPPPPPPPATLSAIKSELISAKAQLDTTNQSLNTLAKATPANAQSSYDTFATEYAKLKNQADICSSRAKDLATRAEDYYNTWNKQSDVQNPDLKRSATVQKIEAQQTYDNIKAEVELTRLAFDPYMNQCKDIGNYLRGNVTPAALSSIGDMVTKANLNYADVNKHVDAVIASMNKIMASTGEGAPVPAPAPK